MNGTELIGAEYWAAFWEWIADKAFVLVVVFLAVEYIAGRWAKPHKEALDSARKLEIAELTKDAETARKDTANAQLQLQQLRFPRSLDIENFEAAVKVISPPASYEVCTMLTHLTRHSWRSLFGEYSSMPNGRRSKREGQSR